MVVHGQPLDTPQARKGASIMPFLSIPQPSPAALVARLTDSKPILFHPCSWHTPQAELDALNRQYPGQVSHTMCDACSLRMMQEIA